MGADTMKNVDTTDEAEAGPVQVRIGTLIFLWFCTAVFVIPYCVFVLYAAYRAAIKKDPGWKELVVGLLIFAGNSVCFVGGATVILTKWYFDRQKWKARGLHADAAVPSPREVQDSILAQNGGAKQNNRDLILAQNGVAKQNNRSAVVPVTSDDC